MWTFVSSAVSRSLHCLNIAIVPLLERVECDWQTGRLHTGLPLRNGGGGRVCRLKHGYTKIMGTSIDRRKWADRGRQLKMDVARSRLVDLGFILRAAEASPQSDIQHKCARSGDFTAKTHIGLLKRQLSWRKSASATVIECKEKRKALAGLHNANGGLGKDAARMRAFTNLILRFTCSTLKGEPLFTKNQWKKHRGNKM